MHVPPVTRIHALHASSLDHQPLHTLSPLVMPGPFTLCAIMRSRDVSLAVRDRQACRVAIV
eukprot:2464823-Rhodomonas_salina.1